MSEAQDYYVYVYIDPRNFEEFYYGKGKGSRSQAHLSDSRDSEKSARIKQIKAAGEEPIIRIVAANLTDDEALLIEKTLIWKLGGQLTNVSSGHYKDKFRPLNSLHRKLAGFDFSNEIYYVNVGECPYRNWDDCRKYGFLSAGQGQQWSRQIRQLNRGDVVVAYLRRYGYVGIGVVTDPAVPVREFRIRGGTLKRVSLRCPKIFENSEDQRKSEYLVRVRWILSKKREEAIWKRNNGLYTTQLVKASLTNQQKTLRFIEDSWGISFEKILERSSG